MPNWYVAYTDDRLGSRVISSTADDDLKFVGNFDSPSKWKSHPADNFNPYTPGITRNKYKYINLVGLKTLCFIYNYTP